MAGKIGEAFVEVGARTKKFDSAMTRVGKRFKAVGASLARIGKRAAIAFGVVLAAGLVLATRAAMRQERAEAMLESVLKSTGYAAGLSAKQIKTYAADLQTLTGIGDEAIIEMQTMIATFKGIKGDNFKRTTEAVMDMAAVMTGGVATAESMRSAAIQLGKALNDPVANMGALSRVGIQFDEQTKKQIKSLTKQGKLFEAQSIILKEVESEFGGVSKAIGKTFAGSLSLARGRFGDMMEEMGKMITQSPIIRDWLKKISEMILRVNKRIRAWVSEGGFEKLTHRVMKFAMRAKIAFSETVEAIKSFFKEMGEVSFWKWIGTVLKGIVSNFANMVGTVFGNLINNVKTFFVELWDFITDRKKWKEGFKPSEFNSLLEGFKPKKLPAYKPFSNLIIALKEIGKELGIADENMDKFLEKWLAKRKELAGLAVGRARPEGVTTGAAVAKKTATAETFAFSEAWKKLQQAAGEKKDKKQQLDLMKKQLKAQETTATVLIDMRAKPTSPIFATGGV